MSEYVISKLEPVDFNLLIPLMKDCFGEEMDISYFQWKYIDNPVGEFVGYIATSSEGEVAAYYGVIPELFIINSQEKVIYQSCDTMTHSSHRRRGLFNKLANHCYDYLKKKDELFIIGFGGAQSTPGFLKLGWTHIFNIRYFFYPRFFSFFIKDGKKEEIKYLENYSSIESAILSSNNDSQIHSHKKLDIFIWRISNPKYNYKVISAKGVNDGSYICYYIHDNKIVIFDFSFSDQKVGNKLFIHLKSILKTSNHKGIIAFCQESSQFSKYLLKYGFISNPFKKGPLSEKVPFILYTDEKLIEKYNSPSQWNISSFDHDSM